jgi:hypothetical protein
MSNNAVNVKSDSMQSVPRYIEKLCSAEILHKSPLHLRIKAENLYANMPVYHLPLRKKYIR